MYIYIHTYTDRYTLVARCAAGFALRQVMDKLIQARRYRWEVRKPDS